MKLIVKYDCEFPIQCSSHKAASVTLENCGLTHTHGRQEGTANRGGPESWPGEGLRQEMELN